MNHISLASVFGSLHTTLILLEKIDEKLHSKNRVSYGPLNLYQNWNRLNFLQQDRPVEIFDLNGHLYISINKLFLLGKILLKQLREESK